MAVGGSSQLCSAEHEPLGVDVGPGALAGPPRGFSATWSRDPPAGTGAASGSAHAACQGCEMQEGRGRKRGKISHPHTHFYLFLFYVCGKFFECVASGF